MNKKEKETILTRRRSWFTDLRWLFLGAVILLGTALRLHGLGEKSLWGDEINTAVLFVRMPASYIVTHLDPNNHTLFSLLAHIFTIGGIGEFPLRMPAAMLGIAAIPVLYSLVKVIFTPDTGLIAAFLLAVSPYHLFFSQEARGYSAMVFFSSLSLLFLFQTIKLGRRRHRIGFILSTALALYSHLFTILLLGTELCILGSHLFSTARSKRQSGKDVLSSLRPWAVSLSILGLLLALLYAPLWLASLSMIDKSYAGGYAGALAYTSDWALDFPSIANLFLRFAGSWAGRWQTSAAISLGCFCLGLVTSIKQQHKSAAALASLFVLPFLCIAILAKLWTGFYAYSRFFIFLLPAYLGFVAYGLITLSKVLKQLAGRWLNGRIPAWGVSCLLAIGLAGGSSVPTLRQVYAAERQDWRGVGAYLAQNSRPGDLVIQTWLLQPNSLQWYFHPADLGVELLRADALRTTPLRLPEGGQVWWVFVHDGQIQRLRKEVEETFAFVPFAWLAVLHEKQGPTSSDEALDATATLLNAQAAFVPSEQAVYQTLANDLLRSGGFELARFYVERGNLQADQRAWDAAILSYQRAVEAWPSWGLAHTKLGNVYRNLGQLAEAEVAYRRAIEVDPGYVGAYLNLGGILESQGCGTEALAFYESAVEAAPTSAWAHSVLGRAYLERGQGADGLGQLQRAVDLEPENAAWLLALAEGWRALGRPEQAAEVYRQVLAVDPNNQQAGQALRDLEP